jgi:Chitobiase/beta-hexosaminidase C-terminal domain
VQALPDGLVALQASFAGAAAPPALMRDKDTVAPARPGASPGPGQYTAPVDVALAPPEAGARVHYTVDGSTPTTTSPLARGPIRVAGAQTIRAMAVDRAGNAGPVADLAYAFGSRPVAPPGGTPRPAADAPPGAGGDTPAPSADFSPAARILAVGLRRRISLRRLRARGLSVRVELARGTTTVRFMVQRRVVRRGRRSLRLVASLVRVPGRAGRYTARLNARSLGLTRAGLYRMRIVPGTSRTSLDSGAARTLWIRVTR